MSFWCTQPAVYISVLLLVLPDRYVMFSVTEKSAIISINVTARRREKI
jgi:hypothetical protein